MSQVTPLSLRRDSRPATFDTLLDDAQSADAAPRRGVADEAPPGSVILDMSNRKLMTRGIAKRRSSPVTGYAGLNGNGKSYCMVRDTLPDLAEGLPVLSTVTLLDPESGNPHPLFTRLESWQQLLTFTAGVVLLDEVTGIADARDQGMPKHIRRHIAQFRRSQVKVRWTGIDWDNTDKRLRQITQAAVICRGHMPLTGVTDVALWAPNRLFVFTTYDAQTLRSAEDSNLLTQDERKKRRAKVLNREIVWGPGSPAFQCYNTMDAVSWVDNSCPICHGKPVERTCRGHG